MSDTPKPGEPREFWIDAACTGNLCKGQYCHVYTTESPDATHVIEKSAYDAVGAERDALKAALECARDAIDDLVQDNHGVGRVSADLAREKIDEVLK